MSNEYCPHGPHITHETGCDCDFRFAIPSVHKDEMRPWIMANVPSRPGCFIIHFERPFGDTGQGKAPAGHFFGWAPNVRDEALALLDGRDKETKFSHIVNVANAKGIKWWVSKMWEAPTIEDALKTYNRMKGNGAFIRKCPVCQ